MTNEQEWDSMMAATEWKLLSREHPDYAIQQSFCEVSYQSREANEQKLYEIAIEDYESYMNQKPDQRMDAAFRKWATFQANFVMELSNNYAQV